MENLEKKARNMGITILKPPRFIPMFSYEQNIPKEIVNNSENLDLELDRATRIELSENKTGILHTDEFGSDTMATLIETMVPPQSNCSFPSTESFKAVSELEQNNNKVKDKRELKSRQVSLKPDKDNVRMNVEQVGITQESSTDETSLQLYQVAKMEIICTTGPDDLVVRTRLMSKAFITLTDMLNQTIEINLLYLRHFVKDHQPVTEECLQNGKMCALQNDDLNWMRVRIVQIDADQSVAVHFVDLGSQQILAPDDVWRLKSIEDEPLLRCHAPCLISCRLYGWKRKSREEWCKLCEQRSSFYLFVRRIASDGTPLVEIVDDGISDSD